LSIVHYPLLKLYLITDKRNDPQAGYRFNGLVEIVVNLAHRGFQVQDVFNLDGPDAAEFFMVRTVGEGQIEVKKVGDRSA